MPEVVVVHLGTNGTINEDDAHEFFDAARRRAQVIVLTLWVDRPWTEATTS